MDESSVPFIAKMTNLREFHLVDIPERINFHSHFSQVLENCPFLPDIRLESKRAADRI